MSIINWFKRLFGLGGSSSAGRFSTRGPSAVQTLERVRQLQQSSAQWPEIWETLNPDGDNETQQLLIEFRGPYSFAPHVALNVLVIGCERAIAASPNATRVQAIREGMRADDQVVRPG